MSARPSKQSSSAASVVKPSKLSKQDTPAVSAPAAATVTDGKPAVTKTKVKVEKDAVVVDSVKSETVADAKPAPVKRVPKRETSASSDAPSKKAVTVSAEVKSDATVVVDAAESVPAMDACASTYNAFMSKLQTLASLVATLKSDFRVIEKQVSRELKHVARLNEKRKRKSGNRSPSGFTKPTRISDTLAVFLNRSPGTELARTEVTREINQYIRTNDLQDKQNGRRINADAKLSALLGLAATDELTYFNLQRYMSHHFVKKTVEVPV